MNAAVVEMPASVPDVVSGTQGIGKSALADEDIAYSQA
jgi:hypothetical protein